MSGSEDQPITLGDLKKLVHEEVAPILAATRTHIDADSPEHLVEQNPLLNTRKTVQGLRAAAERQTHAMRTWERSCPDCGAANPEYKKADVFCADCGSPLGNAPEGFEVKEGETKDLPSIKPCWNCGSQDARLGEEKTDE